MLYHFALNYSHVQIAPAVFISILFVVLLIAKERKNERKRA
jgi:hypothetical protein